MENLPQGLCRYDGAQGHVLSVETEQEAKDGERKVWVKLDDLVRELPIRCPRACVKRVGGKDEQKRTLLGDVKTSTKALLSDGEEVSQLSVVLVVARSEA